MNDNQELGVAVMRGLIAGFGFDRWHSDEVRDLGKKAKEFIRRDYRKLEKMLKVHGPMCPAPGLLVIGYTLGKIVETTK